MTKFGETNIGRSLEQVAGGEDEHVEVVRAILSYPRYRGVHPNAIHNAVSYGHMKILRLLLDAIPDGTELGSSLDDAIHSAARIRGREYLSEMFRLLLNYYDPKNPVPLRAAADCGNVEMVRYILMKRGGGDDVGALRIAQKKGFKDIIELLSAKRGHKRRNKQSRRNISGSFECWNIVQLNAVSRISHSLGMDPACQPPPNVSSLIFLLED